MLRSVVSYRNSTSNHNDALYSYVMKSVVSYRNSTSNHNRDESKPKPPALYLIEILHQTTTKQKSMLASACCILSKFYIKPQRIRMRLSAPGVVSYRNSTSNHNVRCHYGDWIVLYLIEILHQTTTEVAAIVIGWRLYLIEILHQTTTCNARLFELSRLYLIEILHQTTTTLAVSGDFSSCILSKFYIKPQQCSPSVEISASCILSKFYIKPQQALYLHILPPSCILSKFYIKPQLRPLFP